MFDEPVTPTDPLLKARNLPRKVEVDEKVRKLKVHTFLCGVVADENLAVVGVQPPVELIGVRGGIDGRDVSGNSLFTP